MRSRVTIGLIGDYSESVPAHQAIPVALQYAAEASDIAVEFKWIPTEQITSGARISRFDGLWCVPASPYRSMDGALFAIRHAREGAIPFLGTCAPVLAQISAVRGRAAFGDYRPDRMSSATVNCASLVPIASPKL